MAEIKNCLLPDDLRYHVEYNIWLRDNGDGTWELGMTDIAQTHGRQHHPLPAEEGRQDRQAGPRAGDRRERQVGGAGAHPLRLRGGGGQRSRRGGRDDPQQEPLQRGLDRARADLLEAAIEGFTGWRARAGRVLRGLRWLRCRRRVFTHPACGWSRAFTGIRRAGLEKELAQAEGIKTIPTITARDSNAGWGCPSPGAVERRTRTGRVGEERMEPISTPTRNTRTSRSRRSSASSTW